MIYLFHKIDKEKALEYFEHAIKYAKPKSAYHTSYALLHKALIMRDLGKLGEAEKCTFEAIKISKNFSEAFYQNAQYNALLNHPEKALSMLEQAIENDVNYCEKSYNEKDFDNMRDHIIALFEKLRKREEAKVRNSLPQIKKKFKALCDIADVARKDFSLKFNDNEIYSNFKRIEKLIKRHSFRDYLEANRLIKVVTEKIQNLYTETQNEFDHQISSLKSKIKSVKSSRDRKFQKRFDALPGIWVIGILFGLGSCIASLDDYGAFFTALLMSGIIHLCAFLFLKMTEKELPVEIKGIEARISKIREISNELKSI